MTPEPERETSESDVHSRNQDGEPLLLAPRRDREHALVETIFFRQLRQDVSQHASQELAQHRSQQGELRAGWRAGLYVALFVLIFLIFNFIGLFFERGIPTQGGPATGGQMTPGFLFRQEVAMAASAMVAALLMAALEGRRFGAYGMPPGDAFRRRFWQGTLWGIVQVSALMLLIRAFGGYSFGGLAIHGQLLIGYAILWGGFFVVVGVTEEFLFRGYLQFTLTSGMGFWPAATLLSFGFGAVHLANPGEGAVGAASVFVIGMLFCLTLRRTGNLWFAIGMHAAFDFGETFLYSVPDSGLVAPGQMLASSLHGSRWLTGGSIGPEGSALSFVVAGAVFLLFDRLYPRAQYGVESAGDARNAAEGSELSLGNPLENPPSDPPQGPPATPAT